MKTIVLGAGVVGTATAYFLAKHGHEVEVVERQSGAALETSFGNGGVIHASEVEPWSQPGMPLEDPEVARQGGCAAAGPLRRHAAHVALGPEVRRQLHARALPAQRARQSADRAPQPATPAGRSGPRPGSNTTCAPTACSRSITEQQSLRRRRRVGEILCRARARLRDARRGGMRAAGAGPAAERGHRWPAASISRATRSAIATSSHGAGARIAPKLGVKFRYGTTDQRLERSGGRVDAVDDQPRARCGPTISSRRSGSFTPLVLRSVGIGVPIYPVKGVTITVPGAAWHGRLRRCRSSMTAGCSAWFRSATGCASPARPRSPATTRPRARRAARRSSRMSISVFPDFAKCVDPATAKYWAGRAAGDADGHADPRPLADRQSLSSPPATAISAGPWAAARATSVADHGRRPRRRRST